LRKEDMTEMLNSLKKRRDTIQKMKLYDENAANYFSGLLDVIEEKMIQLDDENKYQSTADLQVIYDLTKVEFEIDNYLKTGKRNEESRLVFTEEIPSGTEAEKQHRVNVYRNLAKLISQMNEVDVGRLKRLKSQWDSEKELVTQKLKGWQ